MYRIKNLVMLLAFSYVFLELAGCASIMNPPKKNIVLHDVLPVTVYVPYSKNIMRGNGIQIVRDVTYNSSVKVVYPGAQYNKLIVRNNTGNSFEVEARVGNGAAGSGIIYKVDYKVTKGHSGYTVTFTPASAKSYQQGLIGKFPVPDYKVSDLRKFLRSFVIYYKMQVTSKYNKNSVYANFQRLATPNNYDRRWFTSNVDGRNVNYQVSMYPYHNGTMVQAKAAVLPVLDSKNVYNYGKAVSDIKNTIKSIVDN